MRLLPVLVLASSSAWATVGAMPLAMLADQADVIVIGVGQPARDAKEMASLRVERSLKGKAKGVLAIGAGDPEFSCDLSELRAGERALFFLVKSAEAYLIMNAGRGKLSLSGDSKQVTGLPADAITLSTKLVDACTPEQCPLASVLAEIRPYLSESRTRTAFFVEGGRFVKAAPVGSVRCLRTDGARFEGCEAVDGVQTENPASSTMLCLTIADGGAICLSAPIATK